MSRSQWIAMTLVGPAMGVAVMHTNFGHNSAAQRTTDVRMHGEYISCTSSKTKSDVSAAPNRGQGGRELVTLGAVAQSQRTVPTLADTSASARRR